MTHALFHDFFQGKAYDYLIESVDLALKEDAADLTSEGLFSAEDILVAEIYAKEPTLVAGLPMANIVLDRLAIALEEEGKEFPPYTVDNLVREGSTVLRGGIVARMVGGAAFLLKAERVILNYITHLSGIANLTYRYVEVMGPTRTKLLDTRKTIPGLRYPEKYAVQIGGGLNHRIDLSEMLMLKDNHIDQAGSITKAVETLRETYGDACPPIEVECRNQTEVTEAVMCKADRIMLDNMDVGSINRALKIIPPEIESEISGGVSYENIAELARCGADFISVGRLTHSAPTADFSMRIGRKPSKTDG